MLLPVLHGWLRGRLPFMRVSLFDVEARYGVGSRQAVDVGVMLSVLRRELEMRGVSVEAAERAGVAELLTGRLRTSASTSGD